MDKKEKIIDLENQPQKNVIMSSH